MRLRVMKGFKGHFLFKLFHTSIRKNKFDKILFSVPQIVITTQS